MAIILAILLLCSTAMAADLPAPPSDFELPANMTIEGRCEDFTGCQASALNTGYTLYGCNYLYPIVEKWTTGYVYKGSGCFYEGDSKFHIWWQYPIASGDGGGGEAVDLDGVLSLFFGIMTAIAFVFGVKSI